MFFLLLQAKYRFSFRKECIYIGKLAIFRLVAWWNLAMSGSTVGTLPGSNPLTRCVKVTCCLWSLPGQIYYVAASGGRQTLVMGDGGLCGCNMKNKHFLTSRDMCPISLLYIIFWEFTSNIFFKSFCTLNICGLKKIMKIYRMRRNKANAIEIAMSTSTIFS